jgi:serine/threonine-protein kinase
VKGEDLETRIDRIGAIPEKIALKYVLQIADALDYALKKHELIHKDIKPGNIMVNEDADAFLLDMGIAQRIGEINIKEHIEGSPFYMSPEQSRNETLTWSSDQYSLGATLFNMVVGKPPFDDPDIMRIVGMHTDTPVPDPFKINPDVKLSPATVALIKKMLAKKTEGRFASWVEVKKEIRRILKGRKKKKSPVASSVREKTGHMAGPASSGTSRKIPVKKKKNGIQVLLNLSLVIMILLAGGYFGMRFFMESQAHEAIEMAIKNIQKVKSPDELSLKQLELARSKADNFFVGNAVKNEVLKLYTENKE